MDLYFLLCFKCWPPSSSVRWHCLGWVSLDMGAVCLNGTRWEGRTSESVKSGMHLWRWGVNVGKVSWAENKIFWSLFFGSTKCTTHVLICVGGSYKWCIYFANRHLLCTNHVPVDVHALGIDTETHMTGPLSSRNAKQGERVLNLLEFPSHGMHGTWQIQCLVFSEIIPPIS